MKRNWCGLYHPHRDHDYMKGDGPMRHCVGVQTVVNEGFPEHAGRPEWVGFDSFFGREDRYEDATQDQEHRVDARRAGTPTI